LTIQGFPNYSARMDADLKSLEHKLSQLITLCQNLRAQNSALRQELAQAQSDTRQLRENIAVVSTRLEAVIERLPEESV
jgi:cell division protein ZapB